MLRRNLKGLMVAALLGSAVGTATIIFSPRARQLIRKIRQQRDQWTTRAHVLAEEIQAMGTKARKKAVRKSYINGTVLGVLLGAGATLLLAPKSGRLMRRGLADKYEDLSHKTDEFVHIFNNSKKPVVHKSHKRKMSKTKK